MKRHFPSFIPFLVLAIASCAVAAFAYVRHAAHYCFERIASTFRDIAAAPLALQVMALPAVALVQAREFASRLALRAGRRTSWGMCRFA